MKEPMNSTRMKVSTRLILAFGPIVLLTIVLILLGANRLAAQADSLDSVVDNRWPNAQAAFNLEQQASSVAISLRNMMLNEDAVDRKKQREHIDAARTSADESLALLAKSTVRPEGKEILQRILKTQEDYVQGQMALLGLIEGNQHEDARSYLTHTLRPRLQAYQAAAQDMTGHQKQLITRYREQAHSDYSSSLMVFAAIGIAALGIALVSGWLITRSLSKELGGEPNEAAQVALAVSEGDLLRRIPVRPGDDSSLIASLAKMQAGLTSVVSSVRTGSESVATASAEIAQGNQDLSARTESQASALQETAASMEQLNSAVRQNADNARQANQLAQSASAVAMQGGEVVADVVRTMKEINDSSHKIADIIGVIDGIAFQTNILALNAAVEAARAGEQGRGFAVVASEVRSLAGRSAEAAQEIKGLIHASVERVETGTALVDRAGQTMAEVVGAIQRVTNIMGEISAASSEQSQGVAQVGEAVTQMDQATQQNAALVEEMAAAAASLNTQAQELVDTVAVFKLGAPSSSANARPQRPVAAPSLSHRSATAAPAKPVAHRPATAAKLVAPLSGMASTPSASEAGGEWESF